jgi:hypothetical protein
MGAPARPHTYSAYPRTALATAGGRRAGRLGRSGPAQTGIHGPKARKGPAWNGNRASGAFCGALGDVRLGPEEVPADNPLTSVTPTVEKSAMTQPPPQQPPTQVFVQQRRSGCGTLLVALLVLAIITAIVILLAAFGLLGWIFS